MLSLVFGFLLAGLVHHSAADPEIGNAKIGEPCKRDYNCIENAFCRAQLTCLCEPFYSPSPDMSMCIATAGLPCLSDSDCGTMTNAECRQGVCACKEFFLLDVTNSSNCISRPSAVGDRCQRNDDCTDVFDRALCIDEKCRCFSAHHFVPEITKCVKSRGLYQTCEFSYHCYLSETAVDAMECVDKQCKCKRGDSRCNKGATLITSASLTIFAFAMRGIVS